MTKAELIEKLKALNELGDTEAAHDEADDLVVEYINDKEIRAAYEGVRKWYA